MVKRVSEQVVVVTGASSGIGRETAIRFARQGAAVVLTARNTEALQEVENEITTEGGRALVVPADVSDFEQVRRVAQSAAERFGRIDTWVNNAAVIVYGLFEDTTLEEFRRIMDVNFMGQVHGAKAALPHLKASRGTLIGVGSVLSEVPAPLVSAYVASKHAIKGFYDALRLEQRHCRTGVRVNLVMPGSANTPLFDHAMTHLGVKPAPFPPVYRPELVAEAIVHAAENPIRDLPVGATAAVQAGIQRVWPRYGDRINERIGFNRQVTTEYKPPSGPTNLWHPLPGTGAVHGEFRSIPFDPLTWLRLRPVLRNVALGLAAASFVLPWVAALALLIRRPRRTARLMLPIAGLAYGRSGIRSRLMPAARFLLKGEESCR